MPQADLTPEERASIVEQSWHPGVKRLLELYDELRGERNQLGTGASPAGSENWPPHARHVVDGG